jgi:hypothetical protein
VSIGTTTHTKASRKAKRCWWCGEAINIGERKVSFRGLEDGEFYTLHYHPECHTAVYAFVLAVRDEELPEPHIMKRGSTEYRDE